jgi:hypothetical protein
VAPTIISQVTIPATAPSGGGSPLDLISLPEVKLELRIIDGSSDA